MATSLIIRICTVALIIMGVIIGWQAIDKDNPGTQLIYMIVVGVIGGLAGVKYLIPWIGDTLGTFFFSSGEQVVMDDSMKAVAKLAQGDYQGAITEYEKISKEKPDDSFPVAEIAKIYSDKMGDPQRALSFLQERLEAKAWEEDSAAFLMFRMVDIHADKLKDYQAAHDLLEQVIANFPNTRHSANAHHKLNEVQQAQFKAITEQRLKQSAQNG
jgi:tetratricopeptide (TPR) repeat protein